MDLSEEERIVTKLCRFLYICASRWRSRYKSLRVVLDVPVALCTQMFEHWWIKNRRLCTPRETVMLLWFFSLSRFSTPHPFAHLQPLARLRVCFRHLHWPRNVAKIYNKIRINVEMKLRLREKEMEREREIERERKRKRDR